ncbi:hypothetical protein D5086_014091 [Populus alba]|uniref:Uncharacterized protein n=1 Tax=Populus alba TaxID=43335 RepID=A0ACC4C6W3_POPAL
MFSNNSVSNSSGIQFGTSSAACGDGLIPLSQLRLPQKTTPLLKVMVKLKREEIGVALIADDGTGWISCRKWFCV